MEAQQRCDRIMENDENRDVIPNSFLSLEFHTHLTWHPIGFTGETEF